jgi:hypothetical protein
MSFSKMAGVRKSASSSAVLTAAIHGHSRTARGHSSEESRQLSARANQEEKRAGQQVAAALRKLRAAMLFPDFPYRRVFYAADDPESAERMRRFAFDKLSIVNTAKDRLQSHPRWIYKLDILLDYARKHLVPPIEEGSIFDLIIKDQAEAIQHRESAIDELLTLLSIALMFVPGGVIAAAPVNLTLAGRTSSASTSVRGADVRGCSRSMA